ncbi:MAG: hypothetical protein ACYTAF_15645 [Planctomycetota bacterium]
MKRFVAAGCILFLCCLAATPLLDSALASGAVRAYRLLGGDTAHLHPGRPDTVVTPIGERLPEERFGWRDAGGFYVVFALAVLAGFWRPDRWYALRMLGALLGAAVVWLVLLAVFLGLVCTQSFLAPVLAPHPFVMPGLAAAGVLFASSRLRSKPLFLSPVLLAVWLLILVLGYEAGLVALLIQYPLVRRESGPAFPEGQPADAIS